MAAHPPVQVPPHCLDPRVESLPPAPAPSADYRDRLDGVIVLVSDGHVYLAKACCASIRRSLGDIPITLFVDGADTDTSEVERLPGVSRLVVQEIAGPEYAHLCNGFWVKLVVFWKSPYERFLYLDADTLVWGDVRVYAEFDQYDFIAAFHFATRPSFNTATEVQRFVYDVDFVRQLAPNLDWRGNVLANNGVFFARRGVFPMATLIALRQLDCWRCYEQGVTNYLRWRALGEGTPRMGAQPIQLFPAEVSYGAEDRFLPRDCQRPVIIHWICKKPKLGRRYRTDTDYRKLFLTMTGRTKLLGLRLWLEDLNTWLQRHRRSLGRRLRGAGK